MNGPTATGSLPPTTGPGPTVLGVDFGTSNTVAALSAPGRPPRVLSIDGAGWLPSAVFGDDDGTLAVGRDAERRARLAPERFEANPKRRIDDGDLMLGTMVIPVSDAIAAVLHRVAGEARRQLANRPPDLVTLTHPAGWGSTRRAVLLDAARKAGLGRQITLLPEPVAAAVHFASLAEAGQGSPTAGPALAVYDLGGGTFDCAVVRTENNQYTVAADDGLSDVGGVDFDQALLDQLGRVKSASDPGRWRDLLRPQTAADRRAARALREDVKGSKESLSRYAQAEVALPEPFTDALLSRQEFEGLIRPMVTRTVEVLTATITAAGYRPQQLAGIYLVGGSSRIPLVGKAIADRTGVVPTTLEQPETAVALGASLWPAVQRSRGTARMAGAAGPASGSQGAPASGPHQLGASQPVGSTAGPGGPAMPGGTGAPGGPNQSNQPNGPNGPGGAGGAGGPGGPNQSSRPTRPGRPGVPNGPGGPGGSGGSGRPGGWSGPPSPAVSLPAKKSRRNAMLAGIALLLVAAVAVTVVVLANRNTPAAGPGGGISSGMTGPVTDSGVTSVSGGAGVTTSGPTSPVDPTRCAVDDVDGQGLTPCMRDFAGGLVSGSSCTQDPDELGITEAEAGTFGSLSVAWQACQSGDDKYMAVLFQNTNNSATTATWEGMFSLVEPASCGSWLGGGRSRGEYVVGAWEGGEPTLLWRDPALPLMGLFRSPGESSTITSEEMISDFDDRSGFELSEKDCAGIVPSGDPGSSGAAGGSGTDGDCAAEPIDDNDMTPCIKAVSGNAAAEAAMCFPGDNLLEQFSSEEFPLVAAAACSFTRDTMTASAIYLQAKDTTDSAAFFEQLAGSNEVTDWSQGGMSGRTFSQVDDDGNPAIVWTFTDTPVVVYVGGSPNGDTGQDEIAQPLQELVSTVLLPQD